MHYKAKNTQAYEQFLLGLGVALENGVRNVGTLQRNAKFFLVAIKKNKIDNTAEFHTNENYGSKLKILQSSNVKSHRYIFHN